MNDAEMHIIREGVPGCFGSLVSYSPKTEPCTRCRARERCEPHATGTAKTVGGQALLLAKRRGITLAAYQTVLGELSRAAATIVRRAAQAGIDIKAAIQVQQNPFQHSAEYMRIAGDLLVERCYSRDRLEAALERRMPYLSASSRRRYLYIADEIVTTLKLDR